jgi:hypothetical protein
LTSSNNNHLASTATFLRDLDTRLDSLEKEAVEQLIQQLQEVVYLPVPCYVIHSVAGPDPGSGAIVTLDPGSGIGFIRIPNLGSQTHIFL